MRQEKKYQIQLLICEKRKFKENSTFYVGIPLNPIAKSNYNGEVHKKWHFSSELENLDDIIKVVENLKVSDYLIT